MLRGIICNTGAMRLSMACSASSAAKETLSSPELPPCEDFRCGLFNDGTLAVNAEEGQFTLQPGEVAALRVFLDKMSVVQ